MFATGLSRAGSGLSALALGFVLVWAVPGGARAQEQQPPAGGRDVVQVKGTGNGSYYPGDAARSREEALEAAFRDAVEQASGVFITSETEMNNFELVKDEVLTRSHGFVKKYSIVKEGRDNELYTVVIDAEVERAAFIKDVDASLELLYQRVGKPRVMAVVKETNNPSGSSGTNEALNQLGVTEKEIRQILLKQGFKFIDARTVGGGSILQAAVSGETVLRDKVIELGHTADAEIVILGVATTQSKGKIRSFSSVQANLSLDVVRVDNGQVMASASTSSPGVHTDELTAGAVALKKAAEDITPKLIQQVSYLWVKERNEGSRIEIVVKNITFGNLLAFRQALGTQVKGVKQVTQRSYSDGVALLEVQSRDPIERVAESLYNTKFDKFKVDIEDVKSNRMTIKVTPR